MPSDSYTLIVSDASIAAPHASTHGVAGADAISISATQVTAGTLPVLRGGTGVTTSTGSGSLVLSTAPTLVTPVLGTPAAGSTLTNCTGLPLATGVTGTLLVANGGTGATTSTGTGSTVLSTAPTLVTPVLGTPASGNLANCTGLPISGLEPSTSTVLGVGSINLGDAADTTISRVSAGKIAVEGVNVVTTESTDTLTNKTLTGCTGLPLTTGVTGTLPVANGGTGAVTLTGYVKGTGTTSMTASATVPVGDISGTLPVGNGGTGAVTLTGYVKGTGTTSMTASATVPVGDISGTLPVTNGGTGGAASAYGQIGGQTAGISTTYTTAYAKLVLTTTLDLAAQFDANGVNNRLRYIGSATRKFLVFASMDMFTATDGAQFSIRIAKNGTTIAATQCNAAAAVKAGAGIAKLVCNWIIEFATNDFVEIFVASVNGSEDGTPQRMRLVATPVF